MPKRVPLGKWPIPIHVWNFLEQAGAPVPFLEGPDPDGWGVRSELVESAVELGFLVRVEEPWIAFKEEDDFWVVVPREAMEAVFEHGLSPDDPLVADNELDREMVREDAQTAIEDGLETGRLKPLSSWVHVGPAWWRWKHVLEAERLGEVRPLGAKKNFLWRPFYPPANREVAAPVYADRMDYGPRREGPIPPEDVHALLWLVTVLQPLRL